MCILIRTTYRLVQILNKCQSEVISTFDFKGKKQEEIKHYMSELFCFNGTDFRGSICNAKQANAAFVSFTAFKQNCMRLPLVAITGGRDSVQETSEVYSIDVVQTEMSEATPENT